MTFNDLEIHNLYRLVYAYAVLQEVEGNSYNPWQFNSLALHKVEEAANHLLDVIDDTDDLWAHVLGHVTISEYPTVAANAHRKMAFCITEDGRAFYQSLIAYCETRQ